MAENELNVVIMGAGEVGKGLADGLSREGHNVCVVDINPTLLAEVETRSDVRTVQGNGAGLEVLISAGIKSADLFIGVSASDEHNLLACGVAKQLGVKTTIARVRNDEFIFPSRKHYQEAMKIDFLINPDEVAAKELYDVLVNPVAQSVSDFAKGRLKLIGMRVNAESPICNRMLKELPAMGYHGAMLIVTIVRRKEVIIPRGDTVVSAGDLIYVIASSGSLDKVNEMGGVTDFNLRKVVMVGASRVTYYLADLLDHSKTRLIVIEQNKKRCEEFASELEHVMILNGDGTDVSELTESGVGDAGGFIASSQDDETNILAALLAKEQGAKRVIALLRKPQYIPLMAHIKPIDVAINPRLATIHSIMRYVRQGKILSMAMIADNRAEAVEVVVDPSSPLAGQRLRDLSIPNQVLLGAIVRDEEVLIPKGDDVLQAKDRVVVIGLKETVDQFDRLMTRSGKPTALRDLFKSIAQTVMPHS